MRYSENLSNICDALAKVQSEIKNPLKNAKNLGVAGAPKYAKLEDALSDIIRPVCSKYGVAFIQNVKSEENRVGVQTILLHQSGEYIEGDVVFCDVIVPINASGKKILTEGQATGVCITYLRRYSLFAALGINGDEDTDGSYTREPFENATAPAAPAPAPAEAKTENKTSPSTAATLDAAMEDHKNALAFVLRFGKYNGKTLGEISNTDFNYICWLADNATSEDVRSAASIIAGADRS